MLTLILMFLGVVCIGAFLYWLHKLSRESLAKDSEELNKMNQAFEENEKLLPEDFKTGGLSKRKVSGE